MPSSKSSALTKSLRRQVEHRDQIIFIQEKELATSRDAHERLCEFSANQAEEVEFYEHQVTRGDTLRKESCREMLAIIENTEFVKENDMKLLVEILMKIHNGA